MANSNNKEEFRSAYDDDNSSKFLSKARENPFVPAGIFGGLTALLYSAYKFKTRGEQKMSVYLIHTRVAAQGAVVSAITIGVLYQMYKEFWLGETLSSTRKETK